MKRFLEKTKTKMFSSKKIEFLVRRLGKKRGRPSAQAAEASALRIKKALKGAGVALFALALGALVHFQERTGDWLKASLLEAPLPFDGTVYPVEQVPRWSKAGYDKSKPYSQYSASELQPLPRYDLEVLQFPDDQLVWGKPEHDAIRDAKITYSVVYLGNYSMDHKEMSGSHLAVDIVMPKGTPIRSVANGKVVKTSLTSSGFGHHVVIEHVGVPDPDYPDKTTTLYSAFNHMDRIDVKEGQNVKKGEWIGTSGMTGTATVAHLHYQMDRKEAPWHPWWPFSWAESQAAGLSFFEAVNAGLNMDQAKKYTINPMPYVERYLDLSSVPPAPPAGDQPAASVGDPAAGGSHSQPAAAAPQEAISGQTTNPPEPKAPEADLEPVPIAPDRTDSSLFSLKVSAEAAALAGSSVGILVEDPQGQVERLSDTDRISVELKGVGSLSQKTLRKSDFRNGAARISLRSDETGSASVMIGKGSVQVSFVQQAQVAASLKLEHPESAEQGIEQWIEISGLDESGGATPIVSFGGILTLSAKEGQARFEPATLTAQDFRTGKATVKFTPLSRDRLVIRAQNGGLLGETQPMPVTEKRGFSDVSRSHPHHKAIMALYDQGVIKGYPDGSFKPKQTVNRVEALQMLMKAFQVQGQGASELPFSDTQKGAWYSEALASALNKKIVQGYADGTFRPEQTVIVAEYIKMLFEAGGIESTAQISAAPYADVPKESWYASYAHLLNRKNLLEVEDGKLNPGSGMTREKVAETIYRLNYLMKNDLLTYSG